MTDRGVSTVVGYVIALAIAATLVGGLLIAGGDFVEDTREEVVRQELAVIGQRLAANVEAADRLVVAGEGPPAVAVNETFPEQATGTTYRAELTPEDGGTLYLNATDPSVSVAIEVDNTTALRRSSAGGGDVSVVYDATADELVIRSG